MGVLKGQFLVIIKFQVEIIIVFFRHVPLMVI